MRIRFCALALSPLLGACSLLPIGRPIDIPAPEPPAILAPGDVVRVLPPARSGEREPLLVLTVEADGTVELAGTGPLPVDGYTTEDLAAVLVSIRPELGAVRVEREPRAIAQASAQEASAPRR